MSDLTAAIRIEPTSWELYNERGVVHYDLENHEQAVGDFTRAIRLAPEQAIPYGNRGNALQELARYDESLADFDEALKRDEADADIWNLAGIRTRPGISCRFWRGEDKTGKEGEAGVLVDTSMQPDAVQSPPQPAMNR